MHVELNLPLHPRQLHAYDSNATELLFGGATEGGKSHFARVKLITAAVSVPNFQGTLVRKKYADILANHVEGPTGFRAMLGPLIEQRFAEVTNDGVKFKNGSLIQFVHCQDERQFDSAQGVEKHGLVIDEATQIGERLIKFFRTWVRMPNEMRALLPPEWRDKLPFILYTANPIGQSVPFFKRNFVDARPHETIEMVDGFKRQYMLSRYTDNPSVNEEAHKGRLAGIGDPQLAKALDEGDWNAITGEFFPEWDENRHVIDDFTPPKHWFRFRSIDLGYAEPCAVYWICVSDGEVFQDSTGKPRWFPRGSFILYREWYICDPRNPAQGLRMRNEDIAHGILERGTAYERNLITLSDSLAFQDRGGESPDVVFARAGVILTLGDTSRVPGWAALRSRLTGYPKTINGVEVRIPTLYVTRSCKYARDYIPALPRHPSEGKKEDAAEHGEATHSPDAIRIACMAHTIIRDSPLPPSPEVITRAMAKRPTVGQSLRRNGIVF